MSFSLQLDAGGSLRHPDESSKPHRKVKKKSFEMKKVKDKLFQTSVFFPTNTIPGIYNVDIYYIRNNTIMSTDQKNIVIKKTGIGSQIFDFANENAATYGVFVIIFSIFSGFIAAALFRRSK